MSKKKNIKKFKSLLESLLTSAYDDMNNRLTDVENRLDEIDCKTCDSCEDCDVREDRIEGTPVPNSEDQIMLTNMRQLTSYMDNLPYESRIKIWELMGIKNADSCYLNVEDKREYLLQFHNGDEQ